jgi:hypothetical protein
MEEEIRQEREIVYASDGISESTLFQHLNDFYTANPSIPVHRRSNVVHVVGKYLILRSEGKGMGVYDIATGQNVTIPVGAFFLFERDPDLQAIVSTLNALQVRSRMVGSGGGATFHCRLYPGSPFYKFRPRSFVLIAGQSGNLLEPNSYSCHLGSGRTIAGVKETAGSSHERALRHPGRAIQTRWAADLGQAHCWRGGTCPRRTRPEARFPASRPCSPD